MSYVNADLYNCCARGLEPDWTVYAELVLEGCKDLSSNPEAGTEISGGFDRHEAEFFGVYAIHAEGYADAVTDVHGTLEEAERIMAKLSERSGLPARRHELL